MRAEKNLRDAIGGNSVHRVVDGGFGSLDEFEAARDGEFYDFVEFVARGKFGRVRGAQRAGFKLQIADGSERGGIAHGGASGIRFGLIRLRVLLRGGLRCGCLRLPGRRPSGDRRGKNRKDRDKAPATAQSPKITSSAKLDFRCAPHDVISHRQIEENVRLNWRILPRNRFGRRLSLSRQPPFIEIHSQKSFDAVSVHLAFWLHL